MTLRLALLADDLTGALDTSVSFALCGLRTRVALTPAAIGEALADGPEVLAVNTASRALAVDAAARIVREAALALGRERPAVLFKKIDSRLKGNVGAETGAMAAALGAQRIVVAPAVPDQGRFTRDGAVIGRGVAQALPIASLFAGLSRPVEITDAADDEALDAIAALPAAGTLFVGAGGLGAALARRLGGARRNEDLPAEDRTLFALGSRDPITVEQIAALRAARLDLEFIEVPGGAASRLPMRLPALLCLTGPRLADPAAVAARFGAAVGEAMVRLAPKRLVLGGGDTALAVLGRLGARVMTPLGEPQPGLVAATLGGGPAGMLCMVKSGGFGTIDILAGLVESRPLAAAARA
jgi:uncharacterized protein YgbK (DUF1537 family)